MIRRASLLVWGAIALLLWIGGEARAQQASESDYLDRMSREHVADAPVASAAAREAPADPVRTETVSYATVDGRPIRGYLARPRGGADPQAAILVIHEWWGLNDNIRSMTERLAGEGYAALAVDLYEGEVGAEPSQARRLVQRAQGRRAALLENLRQARAYLGRELGVSRVGTIGWCFGGGWSLQTALLMPDEIDATVIYYGRLVTDRDQLRPLGMPILGIFGAEDRGITVESVREFEAALKSLGRDAEIHIYDGADHAFANPSGTRYHAEAARDAWQKTVAFFAANLK